VTLVVMLLIAGAGAGATAYALRLGGRIAQAAAIGGTLALLLVALLAVAGAGPATQVAGNDPSVPPGSAWGGTLVPGSYLQLVVCLMAGMAVLLTGMAWLLGGIPELVGILPAMLAAVAGTTVALSASHPIIAALGATGTGLVAIPIIFADQRSGRTFPALREFRASLITGSVVAVAAVVAELVMRIVFADPTAAGAQAGSPPAAAVGLGALGLGLVVAARAGAVPFHLRLARLADVIPPIGLPLAAAWIPLPLTVAALLVTDSLLAPLALPVDAERGALVVLALVGLGGAALAAFIADDLRHAIAYLVAADSAIALVAIAALDPGTSGPTRAWLVVILVSKTGLGAWSAAVEDRFATRAMPDLRGWARRAPILGLALVVIGLATFGLPGWISFDIRDSLPHTAVVEPWSTLLMVASFLTLPTYVRLVLLGIGEPAAHVHRAAPEQFRHQFTAGAQMAARGIARLGHTALTRSGQAGKAVAARVGSRGDPDRVAAPGHANEPGADTTGSTSDTPQGMGNDVIASRAVPSVALAEAEPAGGPGPMRARSVASAANLARAAIGPGMAGLRAAAERGRQVVPSAKEVRRGRTELLSTAVLVLALLGAVLAFGGLDLAHAAGESGAGGSSGLETN
jgi:NADH:ubiquinone oxidoreductase subunit 2 (subunit N)